MAGAPSGPQSSWLPEGIGGRGWLLEAEQEGPSGRPEGPQAAAQTVVKPEVRLGTEAGRDSTAGGQAPQGPSSPLGGLGAHSVATDVLVREGRLPSPRDPDTLKGHSVGVPDPKHAREACGVRSGEGTALPFSLGLLVHLLLPRCHLGNMLPLPPPKLVVTP